MVVTVTDPAGVVKPLPATRFICGREEPPATETARDTVAVWFVSASQKKLSLQEPGPLPRQWAKNPARSTFRQFDYDTKPKQESKAREIGRAEETEMMGGGVEDHRTIVLDVKRPADHDGATPDARNRTATKLWTISSSTNYVAVSSISAVAVKPAVAQLISADISPAPNGTAELEIFP
ncbi:hypothetical protein THAOC_19783 [Thalassiosira oceanica]|uniref:Uncharacterized protein n=1 Tax=Thalassiosira oceanica TaxID=159749 RepID=K0SG57_THAOC|nr:hypothetical protein THAOC_19783 [Thalassiosira oceanica]|eukprot:EJK59941.1 hypothetical protein THAOC_19783 [Thalassiosira oceanica]